MSDRMDKGLRRWAALGMCAALLAALGVSADEASAPDPHTLAVTESLLGYCSKAVPSTAGGYQDKLRQLLQGASADTLARVRNSSEYQQARASIEDFVAKVDEHNAKRMCTNGLAVRR